MLESNKKKQAQMEELVGLRYSAVAVKLIREGDTLPEGTVQPVKDWGKHIALCQAFAFARRQGKIVYMEKEDHWCWNPLITYGMIDNATAKAGFRELSNTFFGGNTAAGDAYVDSFPTLPYGEYKGILVAPLNGADFEPDVTLIYCKNDQLRVFLMAIETQTHRLLDSSFNSVDSCIFCVVPPLREGSYRITIPDPGEYERALTPEDDIILTVPKQREAEFYKGVEAQLARGQTRQTFYMTMKEDFARPDFYNVLFKAWGLPVSEEWDKPARIGK